MIAVVTNIDNDHLGTLRGRPRPAEAELRRLPAQPAVLRARRAVQRRRQHVRADPAARPARRRATASASAPTCARTTSSAAGLAHALRGRVARSGASRSRSSSISPGSTTCCNSLAAIAVAAELEIADAAAEARAGGVPGRRPALAGARRRRRPRPAASRSSTTTATTRPRSPRRSSAARGAWPDRRLVLVFQPHRYTRTRDLLDDFAQVLSRSSTCCSSPRSTRPARRRSRAPTAAHLPRGARRGTVEPIFVERVDELPAVLARRAARRRRRR